MIDNNSVQSTKVFVDGNLVGSFQEHFAPKLKGGVFVLNQYHSTGLFKNFRIEPCDSFNSEGACIEGKVFKVLNIKYPQFLINIINFVFAPSIHSRF